MAATYPKCPTTRKIGYPSPAKARKVARRRQDNPRGSGGNVSKHRLYHYECPLCGAYHLTRSPPGDHDTMKPQNPTGADRQTQAARPDHPWVTARAGLEPKGTLKRIVAAGDLGTNGIDGRKPVEANVADLWLSMIRRSGIGGAHGRRYLLEVLRWHHGYTGGRTPVANLGKLSSADAAFVRARAYELVQANYAAGNGPVIVKDYLAT